MFPYHPLAFFCDFSTAVLNWHSLLQDFEQRSLELLIFDITSGSLESATLREYLLILDLEVVI